MAQPLPLYAEIVKVDDDTHMVFGYASTDKRDKQGEIITKSAMEAALPSYMQFANIREMHQPSAVGTAKEASADGKGLWLGAWIGDDRAWMKVKTKIYKGFSVGGRVTQRDETDRSIITGIELSEISLVDRPANPDAIFQIVKRADGQLRPEPLQKWDCGIADHQHASKSDAGSCMSHELLKRCHDEIEADDYWKRDFTQEQRDHAASSGAAMSDGSFPIQNKQDLHNAIRAVGRAKDPEKAKAHIKARARALGATDELPDSWKADKPLDLEKANPHLNSGRFGSQGAKAQEHVAQADSHTAQAATARSAESKHRRLATQARDKGDAQGVAIHEHLAGASAALATQHDNSAEQHRKLAARHQASAKSEKEPEMTTRTVADALQDSTSAVALLASSITDDAHKGEALDHVAEAKEAGAKITAHEKLAGDFEKAAGDARVETEKAKDDKERNAAFAKAVDADLMAVRHHEIAKGYAELIRHYAESGNLDKAVADTETAALAKPADLEKQAEVHTEIAKKATAATEEVMAKHHTALAEAYTILAKGPTPADGKKPGAEQDDPDGDGDAAGDKDGDGDGKKMVKGATMPCPKCAAVMPAANERCQSCGTAMAKADPLTVDGVTAILKGALDQTNDDALKAVLNTALGTLSGGDDATKAAEKQKQLADAAAAERDTAIKALDTVTSAVKGMARDVQALQKRVKIQDEIIGSLKKQVATLEAQPEPSRAKGILQSLRKADDIGGGEHTGTTRDFLSHITDVPVGVERANYLLSQTYGGK